MENPAPKNSIDELTYISSLNIIQTLGREYTNYGKELLDKTIGNDPDDNSLSKRLRDRDPEIIRVVEVVLLSTIVTLAALVSTRSKELNN